jgi:WD40 repeat protein
VWEAATARELLTLKGHKSEIWSVAFSPDNQRIVTGSADGTAKVWDAATGQELLTLRQPGHGGSVDSVAFSPDGERIVTGSGDPTFAHGRVYTAKVWDATTGQELLTLAMHGDRIRSVAFSPDGKRIVTGSYDDTATVWEAARPEQVAAWQKEEQAAGY